MVDNEILEVKLYDLFNSLCDDATEEEIKNCIEEFLE